MCPDHKREVHDPGYSMRSLRTWGTMRVSQKCSNQSWISFWQQYQLNQLCLITRSVQRAILCWNSCPSREQSVIRPHNLFNLLSPFLSVCGQFWLCCRADLPAGWTATGGGVSVWPMTMESASQLHFRNVCVCMYACVLGCAWVRVCTYVFTWVCVRVYNNCVTLLAVTGQSYYGTPVVIRNMHISR